MGKEVTFASEQRQSGNALAEAQSAKAMHEVQAAMTVAKRFPRNMTVVRDRIKNACTRPRLAEGALYQYARGGTSINGPSIRLAEALAQCFDNLEFGVRELEQREGISIVEAYCWDMETNVRQVKTFQVTHWRDTKNGGYKLTDQRDIYEHVANNGARRLRACILGIIPGDIVDEAVEQCNETLHANVEITDESVKKLVTAFGDIGVKKSQIEDRIQCRIDAIRPGQFLQLRKIFASIRDGMSQPEDWFKEPKGTTAADLTGSKPAKTPPPEQAPPASDDEDEAENAFTGGCVMSEEIKSLTITSKPPVITFDYESVKAQIEKHLEDYDIVVTEDTVTDAKKMATELNKQAGEIDRRRIDTIREISAPIRDAEDKLKELAGMCKDGRQRILDQISVFEKKRLKLAEVLLEDLLQSEWGDQGVSDEFKKATVSDLIKLGALTKSDKLTGPTASEVKGRVIQDRALQDRTERRLLELENKCHRAGLSSPLSRQHVEHFLFVDDDDYADRLESLMAAEQKRQTEIEARAIAEENRRQEAQRLAQSQAPKQEEKPEPAPEPERRAPEPAKEPGKVAWLCTATFRVEVKESLTEADLLRGLRKAMEKAGFTTMESISAERQTDDE